MPVALHGNLRDFGIGEVFQLIGQQQKTGLLAVEGRGERLRIAFDRGSVVWAETVGPYEQAALGDRLVRVGLLSPERLAGLEAELTGSDRELTEVLAESGDVSPEAVQEVTDLVTTDTIFSLLRWRAGSFRFTSQALAPDRLLGTPLPAEQILMDGLRMVDEWRTFEEAATQETTVFKRSGRFELFRDAHRGEAPERLAAAERLFLLIDGRLPLRRAVDLSRLPAFEAARLLSRFLQLGVIQALDPEQLARARPGTATPRLGVGFLEVGQLLGWLPLAALALVAWLASSQVPEPHSALGGDVVARADAAFETLRARQTTLAYRYARGRWPSEPADLEDLGAPPLAGTESASYYFRRHGDGVLVLSPAP
ncbi:MAG: hypothetical protein CL910_03560 [Deltaproteobacteria bacterium]|jgi:hypothetical protein|nr:hypothetical protein [Deltaproteobacteria bacterium]